MCSIISFIIAIYGYITIYGLYSAVMYVYCIVSIIQSSMISLLCYDAYYVSILLYGVVCLYCIAVLPCLVCIVAYCVVSLLMLIVVYCCYVVCIVASLLSD